jgi:competence protein ComEA
LPDGAGKDEVQAVCGQCHGLETVVNFRLSPDQWQSEVDQMIAKGAKGTDAQFDLIVRYLAAHFGRAAQDK